MKFCHECGSPLNEQGQCDVCGFGKEIVSSEPNKEVDNNVLMQFTGLSIPKTISLDELKNMEIEKGKLKSIEFFESGMMVQQYNKFIINFEEKYIEKEDGNGPDKNATIVRYSIDESNLKQIEEMINENNLPAWSKIEINTMMMPSDLNRNLTINYELDNKKPLKYTIYNFVNMDDEEKVIYQKFMKFVYSLANDENIINKREKDIIEPPVMSNNKYCPECGMKLDGDECSCGYRR